MGLTYLTDPQPKPDPAHDCELPTLNTLLHVPGTYGQAPESHNDVIVRCDCGRHWHAINGWWSPISRRKALRLAAKRNRRDA